MLWLGQSSLANKLMRLGVGMLLVALASIGLTLWVTWQLEGGAGAVNEAGRMRMQTWRLVSAVQSDVPQPDIRALVTQFDQSLALLRQGDRARPLFMPWSDAVTGEFESVNRIWAQQRNQWLLTPRPMAADAMRAADKFVTAIESLVSAMEHQLSRLTAILNLFQFGMMALAIGGSVVMLYTLLIFN